MRFFFCMFLGFLLSFTSFAEEKQNATQNIPKENVEKKTMPSIDSLNASGKRLLEAIIKNDPESVKDLFFPLEPFLLLKDMKGSRNYHEKLITWYAADIKREHEKIKTFSDVVFDSFKVGRCKWKDMGSENNKIAYWSCNRNRLVAKSGKKDISIDVKVLINWGPAWYVTHLGPIPKE